MKTIDKTKQIGLWMDHADAKLISVKGIEKEIHSGLSKHIKIKGESGNGMRLGNFRSTNNEYHEHNKEINEIHDYYKMIYDELQPYTEILIFGPGTAHNEFANYVHEKFKHFSGQIKLEKTDYLTTNQLTEFVIKHFNS